MNQQDPATAGKENQGISNGNTEVGKSPSFRPLADLFEQQWNQGCRSLRLTGRENVVARHLCGDNKQSAIAGELSITENTVHAHTQHIFRKAGVTNRLGLAMVLIEQLLPLTQGAPRSNAEKRKCVETAFADFGDKSDNHIAKLCGVSQPFVSRMRRQIITVINSATGLGKDGNKYPETKARGLMNGSEDNKAAVQTGMSKTLPRANKDKRNSIIAVLKECPDLSNRAIAERCFVSDMLVGDVRRQNQIQVQEFEVQQFQVQNSCTSMRVGRDGKKYPAKKSLSATNAAESVYVVPITPIDIFIGGANSN
jgi:DNA-binding CsgD family transcriptional regulator